MSTEAPTETIGEKTRVTNLGYTYFVRLGDLIKIGHSARPYRRVKDYPGGEVLAIVPETIIGEFEAHQKFDHLRERNEMFRPETDLLEFIERANEQAPMCVPIPAAPEPVTPPADFSLYQARRALIAQQRGRDPVKRCQISLLLEMLKSREEAKFEGDAERMANLEISIERQMRLVAA